MSEPGTEWPKRAEALAARLPLASLHPRTVERLRAIPRCPEAGGWAAACSGGADSVCLLLLLFAHFPEKRALLRVLHFNHRLRGADADADAAWVESLGTSLGLPVEIGIWERTTPADGVSEADAREARFAFFEACLDRTGGSLLFLGHQRDDVAETMLMRLSRGSGAGGLAAPRPVQSFGNGKVRLRPLLDLGAAEIRKALAETGIPYRRDASNRGDAFYRNRLRQTVIPAWEAASPFDVKRGAAAARKLLEEDDAALESWVDLLVGDSPLGGRPLDLDAFGEKPRAVIRRALNRWLRANGLRERLAEPGFRRLLDAVCRAEPLRQSAGTNDFIVSDGRFLRCKPDDVESLPGWSGPVFLPFDAEIHFPGGAVLFAKKQRANPSLRAGVLAGNVDPAREAWLDAARLEGPLRVRRWRAGDRYTPLRAPGSKKLQDAFTDLKIGPRERRALPVVCTGNDLILWCPGLPPAEEAKMEALTEELVHLTYGCGKAL